MLTSPPPLCQTTTLSPAPFAVVVVCPRPGLDKVVPVMFYPESHHHPIPDFPLKVWPWHPRQGGQPSPSAPRQCSPVSREASRTPEIKSISGCHLNTEEGGCGVETDMAHFPEK